MGAQLRPENYIRPPSAATAPLSADWERLPSRIREMLYRILVALPDLSCRPLKSTLLWLNERPRKVASCLPARNQCTHRKQRWKT
jgi:hypothetical protein